MSLPESLVRPRRAFVAPPPPPIDTKAALRSSPKLADAPPPAPTLTLTPPPAPRADYSLDYSTPAPPSNDSMTRISAPMQLTPPMPPSADGFATTRVRRLQEPIPLQVDQDYIHQLQTAPLYGTEPGDTHKPSRGRAFLSMALRALAPSLSNAQAQDAAYGQPTSWGTLFRGVAGAAGAGAVGAASPEILLKAQRDQQLAEAQRRYSQDAANAETQAKINLTNANAVYSAVRPDLAYQGLGVKMDRASIAREVANNTAAYHSDLVALGKDKADQLADFRDQLLDLRSRGLDQNDERIKQLQRRIDELSRHNQATEGIGQQNANANTTRSLRPPAAPRSSSQLPQAQRAVGQLSSLLTRERAARAAGRTKEADALAVQIRSTGANVRAQFPDLVDDDPASGWPTRLKAPTAPTMPQSNNSGQRQQRFASRQDVLDYARQTGVDVGRAADHFRASGYTVQ